MVQLHMKYFPFHIVAVVGHKERSLAVEEDMMVARPELKEGVAVEYHSMCLLVLRRPHLKVLP